MPIEAILPWVIMPLLLALALPFAAWCAYHTAPPEAPRGALTVALALVTGAGAISLLMLWEGLIGIPYSAAGIILPYLALMIAGAALWWRERRSIQLKLRHPTSWPERFALALVLLVAAGALFNAAYWPFSRDDTLGIYAPHAHDLYVGRSLIPLTGADSLYRTYPMLVQFNYAFAYFVSGWENEYLARVIPTLLGLAALPATYALGYAHYGRSAGWLGMILLMTAPIVGRWVSSGYVDLPMAAYYALAGWFALQLWTQNSFTRGSIITAIAAGLTLGLAAWTKNAALIGVPLLAGWLLWGVLRRRIHWMHAAVALIACGLVAAPWYIRNLIGAGFLIPDTAWTEQAQRTLGNLFVYVTLGDNFGLTGLLITLALPAAAVIAIRERDPKLAFILWWTLPFFAAWWLFASYDPRFLLLFLPPLCALAGVILMRGWAKLPARAHRPLMLAAAIAAAALTAQTLFYSVEFKDELLRDPFMGHAEKLAIVGRAADVP